MENVTKYFNTKFVLDESQVNTAMRKPHFLNETEILDEADEPTGYEIKSKKKKCVDDKPIHVATAILQWSKILFIRYDYSIFYTLVDFIFKVYVVFIRPLRRRKF